MAQDETPGIVERLAPIARDAERLLGLHGELLQSEIRQSVAQVTPALASVGAGAGLAAVGGLLGSLAVVHGLHRNTRLPLWSCYGLVGGLLGAAGAMLIKSGVSQVTGIDLLPRDTIATIKEDLQWATGTTK